MPKFLVVVALALTLTFAPVAQAQAYQHSITILSEDEGPENPEELDHDSDDIQFVILGIVIGLGIAGLITYRRFKR